MASQLTDRDRAQIKEIAGRYPRRASAILPAFHLLRQEYGWVSEESCVGISEVLEVPPVEVFDALSFYTYIPNKPGGKYSMQICHNISCHLNGADELLQHIKQEHGLTPGRTSEDGLFTLTTVECLGACGGSPVMQVAGDYYDYMTPEKFDKLIKQWRKAEAESREAVV